MEYVSSTPSPESQVLAVRGTAKRYFWYFKPHSCWRYFGVKDIEM